MASPLTVSGYSAAVQRGRYNVGLAQGNAVNVVRTMLADGDEPLDLDWLKTVEIPVSYTTPAGTVYGNPGAAGYKPTSDAPAAYNSGGGSGGWDWGGIVKNLFGAVSTIGNAVNGKRAPVVTTTPWVPLAIGGAVLLGAVYLLRKA